MRFRLCCRLVIAGGLAVSSVESPLPAAEPQGAPAAGPQPTAGGSYTPLMRSPLAKTLGGRQFWGDVLFFHDWTIQRNALTGHYRLLDGDDYRHASGTYEECVRTLEGIKRAQKLPAMSGRAVVLVHGIVRSSKSFPRMREALRAQGYQVFGFDYPSTQVPIPEAAEYLHQCLQSMEGVDEIHFVVHSMGGLVVRAYLAEHQDERIRRMVMLGVPNLGACLADRLQANILFKALYGPAGQQLVSDPKGLICGLPTPQFEFAVIAGARGADGWNPLIPGDDDGTISVECTRLPGAADFATVNCLHSFIMNDAGAIAQTVRFLNEGRLRAEGERQPIARPRPADETSN
jgi:pimeloyl-ACP methyl ester carboxylesterase